MLFQTIRNYGTSSQKIVHSVASKGFNLQTNAYAQARPSYPRELLLSIQRMLPAQARIIDLAAGTGLMTKCLVETGFLDVTAVEPAENMRLKLNDILPKVTCLPGTSWDIPVTDRSCDAVIIAQAFHWFDDCNTLQELHRVLIQDGYGILAWNLESAERSDWVAKLRNCYEVYDKDVPQFRKMQWHRVFETKEANDMFKLPYHHQLFNNDYWVPKQDIWTRVLSKSYISCLANDEQEALKAQVGKIVENVPVDDQNRVYYPHDAHLVYFQKK